MRSVSVVLALVAGTTADERFAQLEAQLAAVNSRLTALEAENQALKGQLEHVHATRAVSPLGHTSVDWGRQLSHDTSDTTTCCRWTPTGSCTSVSRQCTEVHEYLEGKTATHVFANAEHANCLGSDQTVWAASFNGHLGNVTLSTNGNVVTAVRTPLLVTHNQNCGTVDPTLTLQMDTTVAGTLTVVGTMTTMGAVTNQGTLTIEGAVTITLRLLDASGSNTAENTDAPASDVIRLDHSLALVMKLTSGRAVTIKSAAHGTYWWCNPDGSEYPGAITNGDPHARPIGENYRTFFRLSPTNGGVVIMCNANYWTKALHYTGSALGVTEISSSNTMNTWERWAIWEPTFLTDGTTPWPYPGAVTIFHPHHQQYIRFAHGEYVGGHDGKPDTADFAFYIDYIDEWDGYGVS